MNILQYDPAQLQPYANHCAVKNLMNNTLWKCALFGVLTAQVPGRPFMDAPIAILLLVLGLGLLGLGAWLYFRPRPYLVLLAGILFIGTALAEAAATLNELYNGEEDGFMIIVEGMYVLAMLLIGTWTIANFLHYATLPRATPSPELLAELDSLAKNIRTAKAKHNAGIIEFTTRRHAIRQGWKGMLYLDRVVLVDHFAQHLLILSKEDLTITKTGRSIWQLYVMVQIGARSLRGSISPRAFEKYQQWKASNADPATHGYWVPHA